MADLQDGSKFQMIKNDPYLEPFEESIRKRFNQTKQWIETIEKNEGSLDQFSKGYEKYGFQVQNVSLAQR